MTELLDARGVAIAPGDTAIYGFGVSRSVAMAEAVVLGEARHDGDCGVRHICDPTLKVSLTPSGRVRLRVVRRSYSSGEKPIVDVAPDRLVVLKHRDVLQPPIPYLPPSPLPTQDEAARVKIESRIEDYAERLREAEVPEWWIPEPMASPEATLAEYHVYCAGELTELRRELRALDDR